MVPEQRKEEEVNKKVTRKRGGEKTCERVETICVSWQKGGERPGPLDENKGGAKFVRKKES